MKATLDFDRIINITAAGSTEIGTIPPDKKGVGQERLRFDGKAIVDLDDLMEIWVEKKSGIFILHAIEVPGAQLVAMTYADRKRLVDDAGTFRLKTQAEIDQEAQDFDLAKAKARLKRIIADQDDHNHDVMALLFAIIYYVMTQNTQIETFFNSILDDIRDVYPLARVQETLKEHLAVHKAAVADYWVAVDEATTLTARE